MSRSVGPRGTFVVFAKRPEAGRVKTRLCPPLSPDQAADLYSEMLADVLAATAEFCAELDLTAVLSVDPPRLLPRCRRRRLPPFASCPSAEPASRNA